MLNKRECRDEQTREEETAMSSSDAGKELTNIEIICFEDEDGLDIEMEVVDEFVRDGKRYVALRPALETLDDESDEDDISFFSLDSDENGQELFTLIEDESMVSALANTLEERLLARL